jgi:nucleotide-binding universal stress UspA family protein
MVQQEVLVGVDDSAESHAALRWALRHARRSGSRVRAVSVFTPPLSTLDPGGPGVPAATGPVLESVERVAGTRLTDAVTKCLHDLPRGDQPELTTQIEAGDTADILLELSHDAELLVLGNGHHGALARVISGSVALRCLRHAPCPLVLVPAEGEACED